MKASSGFADALADAVANNKKGDVLEPRPEGLRRLFLGQNINNIRMITANTENLTDEQRRMLNERHDIENIKPNSPEYDALMRDLVNMGVLSDIPFHMPSNVHSVTVCEDGYILSSLRRVDDTEHSLMGWLENSLDQYLALLAEGGLNEQERLLVDILLAQQRNIFNALQDIFAERGDV